MKIASPHSAAHAHAHAHARAVLDRASAATTSAAPKKETSSASRDVEPQRTPVSRIELRGAIDRAYRKLTGHTATPTLLDTLTAHASLETGSGGQMFNYNFGGIKGVSPTSGETARCRTKEVLGGREVEVRDGFRAYRSLDEGALDYVRLMRDRFGSAVTRAETGDVDGFAHALKQAHYYTADETKYASALRSLAGVSASSASASSTTKLQAPSASPTATFPDSVELGRVLDAIARHPTTVEDRDADDEV